MIEGTPVLGLFVLACTLHDVDPLTGASTSEPYPASLTARGGTGAFTGSTEIDGQDSVSVRRLPDGKVVLSGPSLRGSSEETWAVLKPQGAHSFEMEWLMYDHYAVDGRRTSAVWSKGSCEQVARLD